MNVDAVTIERMVREVLSQTQAPGAVRDYTASKPQTPEKLLAIPNAGASPPEKSTTPTAMTIRERIVTADLLQEQVQPGTRIVISRQAIVTPAAQDYLRNNRITFERQDASASNINASSVRWKIILSSVGEHTARAIDAVCRLKRQVQQEISGAAMEAAVAAISAISRGEVAGIVVVVTSTEVVACRTNRNAAVRAAVINDLASWSKVQPQLKPNVVCINPQGRSFMELQNILNKVVSGPAPEAPAGW